MEIDLVAGLDEAGRGPLAGPVFAAAVILPNPLPQALDGLTDSKKLSPESREHFFRIIRDLSLAWCVAEASVEEIEIHNILGASLLSMRRAFQGLAVAPYQALVDGNQDPGLGVPTKLIVGGDAKIKSISAASVMAKVARDRRMLQLHAQHPGYGLDRNKGYATAEHRRAILSQGPSPAHRRLFLRKILQGERALS